jgi:hypothetical protein
MYTHGGRVVLGLGHLHRARRARRERARAEVARGADERAGAEAEHEGEARREVDAVATRGAREHAVEAQVVVRGALLGREARRLNRRLACVDGLRHLEVADAERDADARAELVRRVRGHEAADTDADAAAAARARRDAAERRAERDGNETSSRATSRSLASAVIYA